MPIRGAGAGAVAESNIPLGDTGITIRLDDRRSADTAALQHALSSGPAQTWTGIEVTVTGELDFWLARQDGFFRLLAGSEAIEGSGLVPPAFNWGAMGLLTRDSFAYLTRRPGRPGHSELGACGHGPGRARLISIYADCIRACAAGIRAAARWPGVPVTAVGRQSWHHLRKRTSVVRLRRVSNNCCTMGFMSVGFRPTEEDLRVIEANRHADEKTSDVIRRALRLLDRETWEERARADMHRLRSEDLSAEPDAWEYDADGSIRIAGTGLTVQARPADQA
jgi:hypothetical protein